MTEKRKRGRPARPMPERIDASPEEIAELVLGMPPKTDWRFLRDTRKAVTDG